jgi:hypothetical protein
MVHGLIAAVRETSQTSGPMGFRSQIPGIACLRCSFRYALRGISISRFVTFLLDSNADMQLMGSSEIAPNHPSLRERGIVDRNVRAALIEHWDTVRTDRALGLSVVPGQVHREELSDPQYWHRYWQAFGWHLSPLKISHFPQRSI